jgi:hypothetical protein
MEKFRCSGVPFRQGMSLRLEPKFKFIIGAEDSDDLGCDWDFASGNAGVVFISCDDSFSHEGAAGSIYCVVVSAGQGASV